MRREAAAAAVLAVMLPLYAERISAGTREKVEAIGKAHGVPVSVVRAMISEESGGDCLAVGPVVDGYSAKGLFQIYTKPSNLDYLMWKYWKKDRKFDIFCPEDNAEVALHYLSDLHKAYRTWYRALLFYNCGRIEGAPAVSEGYAARIISAR